MTHRRATATLLFISAHLLLVPASSSNAAGPDLGQSHGSPVRSSTVVVSDRPAIGAGKLRATIERFSPTIPGANDTLVVAGSITNTSDVSVSDGLVVLRVSPTPLANRNEIGEVTAGLGVRLGAEIPETRQQLPTEMRPGDTSEFRISVAVSALTLRGVGAYALGVEVRGDQGSGVVRQDIDRTFLPWWPDGTESEPLQLSMLWPLATQPIQDLHGNLLSEKPAIEMSPAGRLDILLEAIAADPLAATPMLDPQLAQMAIDLSDGYQVNSAGALTPGKRATEARKWFKTLTDLLADSKTDAVATLYANPDIVAARRGHALRNVLGQGDLVNEHTAKAIAGWPPATAALAPEGRLDDATAARLVAGKVPLAVLSDKSLPLANANFFTPSGSVHLQTQQGPLAVLLADSGLSEALALPMTSVIGRTAARQRILADTLTIANELPGTQRLLVAMPPTDWNPTAEGARMVLDVLTGTPWITPVPFSIAISREPSTLARLPLQYGPEHQAEEIPASQITAFKRQSAGIENFEGVLAEKSDLSEIARTAPSRGLSSSFRNSPEISSELRKIVNAQVLSAGKSVRVVSSGSITVSGSSGTIPVTVQNSGLVAVAVDVALISEPAHLLVSNPIEGLRVPPGRRASVEIPAEIIGAGPFVVRVEIRAKNGSAFGIPGTLTVRSSAYAESARLLVQLATLGLLLAVCVHGIRRARRPRDLTEIIEPREPALNKEPIQ